MPALFAIAVLQLVQLLKMYFTW